MNEKSNGKTGWRNARRILIGTAVAATLIAVFYTGEDWHGKRAWENCKRELAARGETLDWSAYFPPPVPDAENFFKAPKMQEWFAGKNEAATNALNNLATNAQKIAVITDPTVAANFLAWSDQYQPDFDLMRQALKRPYSRMDGDYSVPYEIPIANFINLRAVAQVLAQRTKCDLLLGQPDKALENLTLLNDSRRIMECVPAGKPMTVVDAMNNVAVTGLYVDTIAYGLQKHAWREPQLAALQSQLEQINLPSFVIQALECEPAAMTHALETIPVVTLDQWFSNVPKMDVWDKIQSLKWLLMPRGWIYQNMATEAKFVYRETDGFDSANNIIQPKFFADTTREMKTWAGPYTFMAAIAVPNFTRAWQRTAFNQNEVNEAQIACALERYRFDNGAYPATLDALAPHYLDKLPHDIICGQPLIYRPTSDGKFILYSVGWNERDDGGKNGGTDLAAGDWVWEN
jgi:hypothetical protein